MSKEQVSIKIDKTKFEVPIDMNPVTGEYLRSRVSLSNEYELWLRATGQEDDRVITTQDRIELKSGMHFYTAKAVITPGTNHAA